MERFDPLVRFCGLASTAGLLLLALPSGAVAQDRATPSPTGTSGSIGLAAALPTGEFGDQVEEGFGLAGDLHLALSPGGALGLRIEAGYYRYGEETIRTPLSRTVGRVLVDVTTSNNLVTAGIGPQITLPAGPVRPYAYGLVGLGYFFTESGVEGSGDFGDFARSTNQDDLTHAFVLGGGVRIPFGRSSPAALDLGVQYREHGEAEFLREGSITEKDGDVVITPLEGDTDVVAVRLGVAIGFR